MTQFERSFRLAPERQSGLSCDAQGLYLGGIALLAAPIAGSASRGWTLLTLHQLNRDLSDRYGIPVDLASKLGGLTTVAKALSEGDLVRAQIAALHLQLPDPPDLAKLDHDDSEVVALVRRLDQSGLLKREWDPAKHPRQPIGSPESTGGQFAFDDGDTDSAQAASSDDNRDGAQDAVRGQTRTLQFKTDLVDRDRSISGTFFITPPSEAGGVIVQEVWSRDTDGEGRVIGAPIHGWEAWEIGPHKNATGGGQSDDEWKAPPRSTLPGVPILPSVGKIVTVTAEARFYEGISMDDLREKYGFTIGGSGFSAELYSTRTDPKLPLDNATPILRRSRTFTQW